jgi:hypothetical protein
VSTFATNYFHFELPGEDWVEDTSNLYHPDGDTRSVLIINRDAIPEGGFNVERILTTLPKVQYDEFVLEEQSDRSFGEFNAHEGRFLARAGATADYHRVFSIAYYDRELTLHWAGPNQSRPELDAAADRMLESLQLRRLP